MGAGAHFEGAVGEAAARALQPVFGICQQLVEIGLPLWLAMDAGQSPGTGVVYCRNGSRITVRERFVFAVAKAQVSAQSPVIVV